jgi:hypothetical protein
MSRIRKRSIRLRGQKTSFAVKNQRHPAERVLELCGAHRAPHDWHHGATMHP